MHRSNKRNSFGTAYAQQHVFSFFMKMYLEQSCQKLAMDDVTCFCCLLFCVYIHMHTYIHKAIKISQNKMFVKEKINTFSIWKHARNQ